MKKSLVVMLMVLGFALQEPVYERMDEYIRCRDVDVIYEGKYVERVYFVRRRKRYYVGKICKTN